MKKYLTALFIICSLFSTPLLHAAYPIGEEPDGVTEFGDDEMFLEDDQGPYEVSEAPYDYTYQQRKNIRNKGVIAIGTIAAAIIAIIVASSNNGDPEKKPFCPEKRCPCTDNHRYH